MMKKLITTVAVLACASIVTAQTVTSQNIVGYTKVTCPDGQLVLAALNFDTGGLTLNDLVGEQLANGSVINIWDKTNNQYINSTKTRAGWGPNAAPLLGDGLWITSVGAAEVILSGEVLLAETNTVALSGLDMTGYYYPVAALFESTDLAAQADNASVLNVWNGVNGYDNYTKTRAGWGAAGVVIDPAQGFWFTPNTPFTWSEERPFTP